MHKNLLYTVVSHWRIQPRVLVGGSYHSLKKLLLKKYIFISDASDDVSFMVNDIQAQLDARKFSLLEIYFYSWKMSQMVYYVVYYS